MKANTSSSVLGGANTLWLVPTLIKPDTTGRQRATASPPPRAETSHSRASWCRGAAPRCAATRTLTLSARDIDQASKHLDPRTLDLRRVPFGVEKVAG